MSKHFLVALFILPVAFMVAACANVLDVDFSAAHLDDTGEGGITLGDGGGKAGCTPKTCQTQGFECGTQNDGCGEALSCGTCKTGACTSGKCGCVAKTCPELKVSCGKVENGCGALLDCGGCPNPSDACDSQTNACACKPKNCMAQGAECGAVPDGCGQTYACGDCMGNPKGNFCTAGKCGSTPCTPKTCKELGKNCGQVSDGCSTVLTCGTCTGTDSCGGAGVANLCGCTAKTCPQLGDNCGAPGNGCGGTLSCGMCAAPNTCGGGGTANSCGCTPTSKCPAGTNCGTVANGCGGNVACGAACVSPNSCGGGGAPNVCGCTPLTCADYDCGVGVPNGCGGTLNCGKCGIGCFAEDTPILMADGTLRPIASIKAGDVIMGFDEATMQPTRRTVERLMIHPASDSPTGTVVLNGSIRATRNHPFLSNGLAVRAERLRVGDTVHVALNRGGRVTIVAKPVTSVMLLEGGIQSYDLKTSPPGGYIVGNDQTIVLQKVPL